MPRLKRLSGDDACEILRQHGFALVRQRGSHMIMQRSTTDGTRSVPVPRARELAAGTLLSITRQSGVPRSEFESD
ncbi:type II toxin-antitoxin system HicA family toxin [bacterium]|nr:type II toxin-antitoxin system HicA family toxin [bacterium]